MKTFRVMALFLARAGLAASIFFLAPSAQCQTASPPPTADVPATVKLVVPKETPLRVQLESKVRVKSVGAPVKARLVEPIYSFDRIVIPAGSELLGKISKITPASRGKHIRAALDGDFSPPSQVEVSFETLVLADGKQIPIETVVSPGIPDVVRLVSPVAQKNSKASEALDQATANTKKQIHDTIQEMKSPGKMHRVKEMLIAQLPYRHQWIPEGTTYIAELQGPLNFGTEPLVADELAPPGTLPPADSEVKARLVTALDSSKTPKDAPVEVLITQPLFGEDKKLILPEGSHIVGHVSRVSAATGLHHNGQLQIVFDRIDWPSGVTRPVEASLDSVSVSRDAHLRLDSEGGTAVTDSKTRYLSTGLAIALAANVARPDAGENSGDVWKGGAAGGSGFRVVGMVAGLAAPSSPLTIALGAYGAASAIYGHFLSHGQNVVLQKHTPLEIGFGAHEHPAPPPAAPSKAN
ncbi:MAG: hypothetical protein ACRD50_07295 [Candidatus Acidiferrales bacterium]